MAARTYDARKLVISYQDVRLSEFADGDFLTAVPVSDTFSDYVGSDGKVSRASTNDPRVTVTLTLGQTSPANAILSALSELDRVAANGAGVSRLLIQDLGGGATGTKIEGAAWIKRKPDVGFARDVGSRAWTFLLEAETWQIGGNL